MIARFRGVVMIAVVAAMLANCDGLQTSVRQPGAMPQNITAPAASQHLGSSGYKILTSFSGLNGDKNPAGDVVAMRGKLYGTTSAGGVLGAVFSVNPATGTERVLHHFQGQPDGAAPLAGLTAVDGKLYGTTASGGVYEAGTVFSVTRGGKETVLYSFGGYGSDGELPQAPLIYVNSELYGTTYNGTGSAGSGTVFSVTLNGQETVLHRFTNYPSDGAWPLAGLTYVNGLLYGTTTAGGTTHGTHGAGTVFSITSDGRENLVFSFLGDTNGSDPMAGLISANGALYGTTTQGGKYRCGTVFRISKSGSEKVVHNFRNVPDGCFPYAGLIDVKGTLYGTTGHGGSYYQGRDGGGTVFSIAPTGKETVLHSFGSGTDGSDPLAGLTNLHGTLYGTTSRGGAHGYGTVFALTP